MSKIIVIGLGPGSEEHLTKAALDLLKGTEEIFLRTEKHPVVSYLKELQIKFNSFDYAYEELIALIWFIAI